MKERLIIALALIGLATAKAQDSGTPLLHSGDNVALIGTTFVERARLFGELELALQLAPGATVKDISVRNLGWSGDSVYGDSRSYFGPPQEGRDRLFKTVGELQPQVVFLFYGTGEAMSEGQSWTSEPAVASAMKAGPEAQLEAFVNGYQALIDGVKTAAGTGFRELVLVSPTPLENLGAPLPDHTVRNRQLARYRDAIRTLSQRNGARFVDLFALLGGDQFDGKLADPPLTNNGIHYDESGYRLAAQHLTQALGYPPQPAIEGQAAALASLKAAILEKDRLFFHRWRPANETYLFLFRKHEQGQNAKEIPEFDPLIKAQEARIQQARSLVFQHATQN